MTLRHRINNRVFGKEDRRLAANTCVIVGDGIAEMLEVVAEEIEQEIAVSSHQWVRARTMREAADYARTTALDLAERIKAAKR